MKVNLWGTVDDFIECVLPTKISGVTGVVESVAGGVCLQLKDSSLILPSTVVIEFFEEGESEN